MVQENRSNIEIWVFHHRASEENAITDGDKEKCPDEMAQLQMCWFGHLEEYLQDSRVVWLLLGTPQREDGKVRAIRMQSGACNEILLSCVERAEQLGSRPMASQTLRAPWLSAPPRQVCHVKVRALVKET